MKHNQIPNHFTMYVCLLALDNQVCILLSTISRLNPEKMQSSLDHLSPSPVVQELFIGNSTNRSLEHLFY